jgi:hypothetical protein
MRAIRHAQLGRLATLATLLLLPAVLRGQGVSDLGPVVWRMRGTLVADKQAANDIGWTGVSIGFTGQKDNKVRWLGAVHAEIFGGDTFDAWSYVDKVAHYTPTFTVAGPPDLASQLLALPDGSRVALEGMLDRGARTLLLDAVKPLAKPGGS